MKKYIILYNGHVCPTVYGNKETEGTNKIIAVCDTLKLAQEYCENLVKKKFNNIESEFKWLDDYSYSYSKKIDVGCFEIGERYWYTIRPVDYMM